MVIIIGISFLLLVFILLAEFLIVWFFRQKRQFWESLCSLVLPGFWVLLGGMFAWLLFTVLFVITVEGVVGVLHLLNGLVAPSRGSPHRDHFILGRLIVSSHCLPGLAWQSVVGVFLAAQLGSTWAGLGATLPGLLHSMGSLLTYHHTWRTLQTSNNIEGSRVIKDSPLLQIGPHFNQIKSKAVIDWFVWKN